MNSGKDEMATLTTNLRDSRNPSFGIVDLSVKVKVALRLTISQSLCLGVEHTLGLVTRYYFLSKGFCLKVAVLALWGAHSDERTGLQFAVQSLSGPGRTEPETILYCLI
jgi:hypothetical protein